MFGTTCLSLRYWIQVFQHLVCGKKTWIYLQTPETGRAVIIRALLESLQIIYIHFYTHFTVVMSLKIPYVCNFEVINQIVMHLLHLTFLYCIAGFFSPDTVESSSQTRSLKSAANRAITAEVESPAANLILQSKDGGQSWQDISQGLPEREQLKGFFAGESGMYLRVKNQMYRSQSNFDMPVWEEEIVLDTRTSDPGTDADALHIAHAAALGAVFIDGFRHRRRADE